MAVNIFNPLKIPARLTSTEADCPKQKFSKREATLALQTAMNYAAAGYSHRQERRVYLCSVCGWHHLTSTGAEVER